MKSFITKKRLYSIILIFTTFTTLFTSCKPQKNDFVQELENVQEEKVQPITIGFSIDTLAIERWRRDCDIFLKTARELGAEVIVQTAGNKVDVQVSQLEYLIKRNVSVIVIVPKKADALSDVIKTARSKGISVIAYDRIILNADINLYMTVDSYAVGWLMADSLMSLRPYGNWYCFYGPEDDYNMTFMQNGIKNRILGTGVKIGFIHHADGWNYDLSYEAASNVFSQGKSPDAIIAGNDAVAGSIIRALSEKAPGKIIPISAQDADITGCQNIISGRQYSTIYKPISELAVKAANAAVQLAQGIPASEIQGCSSTVENGYGKIPVMWLQPVCVTRENLDEVIVKNGFHTREEIYR